MTPAEILEMGLWILDASDWDKDGIKVVNCVSGKKVRLNFKSEISPPNINEED